MRKNYFFFKSLLLATVLMLGSANAWADITPTTVVDCDFENSETLFTASGRMTGANAVDPDNASNHVYKFTSASNAGNVAPGGFAYYDLTTLTKTAVKVDVSFDCKIPQASGIVKISIGDANTRISSIFAKGAWGYSSAGAMFGFGSNRGKLDGKNNENYAQVNSTNYGSTTTIKANELLGLWVTVEASIDITNNKISYSIKNKSTKAVIVSATDADYYSTSDASECTQIDIQTGVNSQDVYVDNLTVITYVDESESFANYTIKYKYGATEIKDSRIVENAKVGSTTTILPSDKNAIWYGEPSEKYIYESDDADEQTVAENGSTEVTVSFRKANVEEYTVNLTNSATAEVLVANAYSGDVIEGENKTVYYHKAINVDGTWYVRNQNGGEPYYGINVVAGTNAVSYTANANVKYFYEMEDLPVVKVGSYSGWRNDGMAARSSNGQAPRHYAKNYAYTGKLAAGNYTVTMNARNQSGSTAANINLAYFDAEENIVNFDNQFDDWAKGQTAEKTVDITLAAGNQVVLKCGDSNSNLNMDFLMFTINSVPAKITSSTGLATLYTAYPLDFTGTGLTAYTGTYSKVGDDEFLNLEPVEDVPANTGVVLKGAAGTYNIPVIASSETAKGDLTGSATDDTEITAALLTTNDIYGLAYNSEKGKAQFTPVTSGTIAAGKAFLQLPKGSAKALRVVFNGEATDVTAPEVVETEEPEVLYNMAGIPVGKDFKGYVINQKGEKRLQR